MADLIVGAKARVRPVIVEGDLREQRFDTKTGAREVLLVWTAADGEMHERWFAPDDLEVIPADVPPAA